MARRSSALPEKIAQDLMQRILKGEYDATSILPSERALQDSYGVSRTVVREALKLLAARGLVTTGGGQGAVIGKNLTAPAIDALLLAFHRAHVRLDDLLNTRMLIEPEVIRMLLFGFALVLMMLFRPAGILPSETRKRELETGRNHANNATVAR